MNSQTKIMKQLREVLLSIQTIVDTFDGDVSFKNLSREYFFVNDHWLASKNLTKEDVIGKTDDEILSVENAAFARKSDMDAFASKGPIEYTNRAVIEGVEYKYVAIKWVIHFSPEEPLLLCTIADFDENKEKVQAFRKNVDEFFTAREI